MWKARRSPRRSSTSRPAHARCRTGTAQAFVYAYVLDGTVRSKLDDKPVTTYRPGENWVEQPGAHHVLTENASPTEPAKLLVVFVSDTGDELKVNDPKS
ncbi:cupin domain-containing protein [Nonomuraea aridisoli]|uniref:cupin domain-containing protein n=1 Tax=Nonomuraea aridisoli TaxID=2070368 RepID=UPI001C64855B|nr:cupin domain-containing protein [Nonomuraea aridisoli]